MGSLFLTMAQEGNRRAGIFKQNNPWRFKSYKNIKSDRYIGVMQTELLKIGKRIGDLPSIF